MSRRAIGPLLLSLLAVLAASVGCGLAEDARPRALSEDDLPAGLVNDSTTTVAPGSGQPVTIYVAVQTADEARLARITRRVEDSMSVSERLRVLLAERPTKEEQDEGLVSLIPEATQLLDVSITDDRAQITIDLSADLNTVQGQQLRLALAQLVWTATEIDELKTAAVRFQIAGQATPAIDGEGNEKASVVRRDYLQLRPLV
ncbi:MAG: GerMN domain-containing protein [Acidimicrobiia bacterium]